MNKADFILYSGAASGTEEFFGQTAEKYGIEEVNFSFENRKVSRNRGIRILNHEELENGDVSLTYLSKLMNREYSRSETFRKIIQTIWHQINNSQQIFVIGQILEDNTVKGGTGWGAEFAKLCNKPLFIFDQKQDKWYKWNKEQWIETETPEITENHFCGTGTRYLEENGKKAIEELFAKSFS